MNEEILTQICNELKIGITQVQNTLKMLEEGNTVPFIARYRKELTGGLDEDQIRKISEYYEYECNLLKRKEDVIRLIDEKGLLTEELQNQIMSATKLVEVEDLYRPYKEKKKTKATEAIKNGLEPLAKIIMSFPEKGTIEEIASKFINENVKDVASAIEGAKYIIAEWISDDAYYRKWIRGYIFRTGNITSELKKNAEDAEHIYDMYYDYSEMIKFTKSHRILAMNRGENEKKLTINIVVDSEAILNFLENKIVKNKNSFVYSYVKEAIEDSYKRLIFPSIEREVRSQLTEEAEEVAIKSFGQNLENLLLTPPLKEKNVLAFDPGFVNGCKIAVIDKTGKYLDSTVIKPFLKNVSNSILEKCKSEIAELIKKYNVEIIAIGNGTASRESERFCSDLIKEFKLDCKYVIVSEAGASIYSASKVAGEEFPDLAIEKRSAVSIGRRLQDPLSELVKIPPEGIGVGLYQHDVSAKRLKESLDFVTEKAVNSVGVNVNTASPSILKYVSGIKKSDIEKIIQYREENGKILSREELVKKKILTAKVFEQSAGFLKIIDGKNPFDQTFIHPESYKIAESLIKNLELNVSDIGSKELIEKLDEINVEKYAHENNVDIYTLTDVINSLKKPNLDPRDEMPQPILKSDVLELSDLKVGMKLQGTVRNVTTFGAFIDIGLHQDGLVHISQMSKNYIKDPSQVVSVGDIVDCYVLEINDLKQKVSLSLIEPGK